MQVSLQRKRQAFKLRAMGVEYHLSPQPSGAVREGKKESALRASVGGGGRSVREVQRVCVEGDGDRVVVGI